jgi:hypothetical protein
MVCNSQLVASLAAFPLLISVGHRSIHRDLEAQLLMITKNPKLQRSLKKVPFFPVRVRGFVSVNCFYCAGEKTPFPKYHASR